MRCDHCRGRLGLRAERYWHMRFCSPACVAAYQRRLDDTTRLKIDRLDLVANDNLPILTAHSRARLARIPPG
jgi:hypothetical protein